MNHIGQFASLYSLLCLFMFSSAAHATPCGEFIYGHGMLKKYEYAPLNLTEGTKKHGSSSSSGYSTDGTTAAVDPGVTTGTFASTKQSSLTEGACKWMGMKLSSKREYEQYIAQNMDEIKNEMAAGKGGHLQILASAHSCSEQGREVFPKVIRKNFERFVDLTSSQASAFGDQLTDVVITNLAADCSRI